MATNLKTLRSKPLADMSASELKSFISAGKRAGASLSTSKELNKAQNLLKVLEPSSYGAKQVESAKTSLQTQSSIPTLEKLGIDIPTWKMPNAGTPFDMEGTPTATGDISSQLSSYQQGIFSQANSPEIREQIAAQLEPQGMAKPEPLNRVEMFERMRAEYGVTGLENTVNSLKAQIEEQVAIKRQRTQSAEAKPVAMGVIAGRVGEIERQEAERIDVLTRQLNTLNDQLNTSYNMIQTYMNYAGLDYQDAVNAYNTEYNKNLQIYKLVDEELDEQTAQARANLQIYMNAIEKGNINYNSLPASQKSLITKLEVQSGLPAGFTSSLKATDAGGKVLSTTTREVGGQKYVDVVMQMPDGSMKVKSQALGAVSGGTGSAKVSTQQLASDMNAKLRQNAGSDGKVSPDTWNTQMRNWISETGGTEDDFVKRFSSFVNKSKSFKNWWDYYNGFENPNK